LNAKGTNVIHDMFFDYLLALPFQCVTNIKVEKGIDMKKWSWLIFLILLLLVGCSSKEYERYMELGTKAVKEENYDEAVSYFKKALEKKNKEEAQLALHFSEQIKEADDAFKEGRFEAAILIAENIKNAKETSTVVDIIKTKAEKILKEAEKLDAFSKELEQKMTKGKKLVDNNQFDEALVLFKEIAETKEKHKKIDNIVKEANEWMIQTEQAKTKYEQEQEKKRQEEAKTEKKKESNENMTENKNEGKSQVSNSNSTEETENQRQLTHAEAEQLVRKYLNMDDQSNLYVRYDHDNEKGHYVIHVYEFVVEDPETGEGHTATIGWYAVDPKSKQIYNVLNE
jgi:tetratricopeptide (TPR) repeat protein